MTLPYNPYLMPVCMVILINVLWQIGGQFYKPARRYGIAVLSSLYAYFYNKDKRKKWMCLVLLSLIGILSLGYGESSAIRKWLGGSDILTRAFMACIVSIVCIIYGLSVHTAVWVFPTILVINNVAWQVRAGSLGKVLHYDILIEDICRATALGVSLTII